MSTIIETLKGISRIKTRRKFNGDELSIVVGL